jgi:metallo-beta-lactamase family protein
LGGAGSVTGSSFLVQTSHGNGVLVDCGLFQGGRQIEARNRQDWGFDPARLQTVFLTHAHIDHSGRIPKLVKDGFRGRIIASPPTVDLCGIMLRDSAHIQEMDAEWQTRRNRRQGDDAIQPVYTMVDAEESLNYLEPRERDQVIDVEPGIRARFRNAGHILGSSILELWVEEESGDAKLVFSGDLGRKEQLIVNDPHEVFDADYLFVESTYGNRLHRSFEESREELLEAIQYAVSNGEKVIIPAFALERTQEVLYLLGEFSRKGLLPDIPVYLDSPLAIKATEIFRRYKKYYDEAARAIIDEGFDPFDMPNLRFTPSTEESIGINRQPGAAIIVAASGMCTAGRIKHHLKHNLWRPGASVVIVGFQAEGTTGRQIVDGADRVKIFREDVAVRARVYTIGGFSAHADQRDLLAWVGNFKQARPRVFTIHGEPKAASELARRIEEECGLDAYVPRWKETLLLTAKEVVAEKRPEAISVPADTAESVVVLLGNLDAELQRLWNYVTSRDRTEEISEGTVHRLIAVERQLKDLGPPPRGT